MYSVTANNFTTKNKLHYNHAQQHFSLFSNSIMHYNTTLAGQRNTCRKSFSSWFDWSDVAEQKWSLLHINEPEIMDKNEKTNAINIAE